MKRCPVKTQQLWEERKSAPRPARLALARAAPASGVQLIAADELRVVFQPIVELETDTVFGQEALVRGVRPELTAPVELFHQAHAWNCAAGLGRMVRSIAVPAATGQRLFVNVHPAELDEDLLLGSDDPILGHDAPVVMELTESLPIADLERSVWVIRELRRRAGIELAIDDLGAGYSNLKLIAELEPAFVKLDRGLVEGMARNPRQQKVASWLVRMCADLGARVVAEGVETSEDLAAVRDTGAGFAQGFLLGRPEPRQLGSAAGTPARAR